jgi:peptidoglycan/xylan/chitin deacetylase (PgdA/CDA1 family)
MITSDHKYCYVIAGFIFALIFILPQMGVKAANNNSNIVCYVYHRFDDNRYPSTNISNEIFRGQLAYLKQNNFTVWPLGKAVEAIRNGEAVPPKTVVLTIDDAYHSFYENGLPLLEEFGYPATLFVNTENVGNPDFLSWEEIIETQLRGIEIGNHSHGHAHFLDIPQQEERNMAFINDLVTAHSLFTEHLGKTPLLYSYPYGEYDMELKGILEKAGYIGAAAQFSGVLYQDTDLFMIPRFPMGGPFANLKGFIQKAQMSAMPLISKTPEEIIIQENPPLLEISFRSGCIDADNIQCFVNGERNCILELQEGPDMIKLKMVARDELKGRRNVYTITAPSKNGNGWCWYSQVWVNPAIKED